jgi:co-chaperonin GroES (HSP10)
MADTLQVLPVKWPDYPVPDITNPDQIAVTGKNLLIRRWPSEETYRTPDGQTGKIVLPSAALHQWAAAWIIAVGPDAPNFHVGQSIVFNPTGWADLPALGKDFGFLNADDVILVIKES